MIIFTQTKIKNKKQAATIIKMSDLCVAVTGWIYIYVTDRSGKQLTKPTELRNTVFSQSHAHSKQAPNSGENIWMKWRRKMCVIYIYIYIHVCVCVFEHIVFSIVPLLCHRLICNLTKDKWQTVYLVENSWKPS